MEKNLFNYDEKPKEKPKTRTFDSLNIHQKINYKANACGFARMNYLNRYYYFHKELNREREQPTDRLTKAYWWHYEKNSGGFNRMETYFKEKEEKKKGKTLF